MSYSVFISHCMVEEDSPVIRALAERLRGRGIEPYMAERDPQPGRSLSARILERIRSADLVAVFWTKRGASSEWVNQEVGAARSAGKLVVPIVEKGVRVRGVLEGVERIEFDRDDPDSALESLESFLANRRDAKLQAEADAEMRENLILFGVGVAIVVALVGVLLLAAKR